jgi:hypothetical protein
MSTPPKPHFSTGERVGVQAARRFAAGTTIERAPIIVIPAHEAWILGRTGVAPYLEPWETASGDMALPLGLGAIYRDDGEPNAKFVARPDEMAIDIVALRDIEEGEDVVVSRLEDTGLAVSEITFSSIVRDVANRLGLRSRRGADKM